MGLLPGLEDRVLSPSTEGGSPWIKRTCTHLPLQLLDRADLDQLRHLAAQLDLQGLAQLLDLAAVRGYDPDLRGRHGVPAALASVKLAEALEAPLGR